MRPKKTGWSRATRVVVAGLIFVFVGIVFLLFLLTLSPGERLLKGFAEKQLKQRVGLEVSIGQLETNLLSRLQLRDVQIYQMQAGETIPFLTLNYAKMEYSLADLLSRRLHIRSLDIDSLNLTILRDTSGAFNLPLPRSSAKPDSSLKKTQLQIQFDQLSLRKASLQYLDNLIPIYALLHNLNFGAEYQGNETYSYTVQVDSGRAEYQDIPLTIDDLQLAGMVSPKQLRVDSISTHLPGFDFMGNGEVIIVDEDTLIRGDFRLQGNPGSLLHGIAEHWPKQLSPIRGDMNLTFGLRGSISHPKVSTRVELTKFDIASARIHSGLLEADWEPGHIDLENIKVELLGGVISGQGEVLTDSLFTSKLSMSVKGVDLAKVCESLYDKPSPYQGKISGQLSTSGPAKDPKALNINANFGLRQIKYRSKSLPDFSTKLSYEKEMASFWFGQGNSEISAKAKLHGEFVEGEFSARIPELEPLAAFFDFPELTGQLEIQGMLGGKLSSPEIRAEVKAQDIKYQNFPLDSLNAHLLYRDKQAYVSGLQFAGNLDPIDTLRPPLHIADIKGGIIYQGYASGSVDSLKGELIVDLIQPGYGDIAFDKGQIKIEIEDQLITLSSLQLLRDSLLIEGVGEFDIPTARGKCDIELLQVQPDRLSDLSQGLEGIQVEGRPAGKIIATFDLTKTNQLSVQLDGDKIELDKLNLLLAQSQDIGGFLQFSLNLSGNLDHPQAELDFYLRKPRFQSVEMDSLLGHMAFASQSFIFEPIELHDKGHYSWITGKVDLKKKEDGTYFISHSSLLQGRAKGESFDLSLFNPFIPQGIRVSGHASYDLSWNGTLANPNPVGKLSVSDGSLQPGPEKEAIRQIKVILSVQDSILNVENVSGVIRETPFKFQAQVTASKWKRFELETSLAISDFGTVSGKGTISQDSMEFTAQINQMDLSLLQPFLTDVEKLSGTLNTEVRVIGLLESPQLEGQLEVQGLVMQPLFLDTPMTGGVVKVGFSQNQVYLDSLFIQMGGGTVFATGTLTHELGKLSDANVQAVIKDVNINRPREANVLVRSAQFNYRKQNNYYLLEGDIVMGESRFLANFKPQSILSFVQAVERPKKELPPFLQQIRMDIRLRESEKIWIDNNLARLRLHTELGIVGSPAQPNVTGRVSVEEGYILYLDRKFKVKNGVVDFVDPDRLNPIIDFAAEATVKTYRATEMTPYTVTITIAGPLDEVVVELKSEPPLDKSNILSLLTLGVSRDELVGKDTEGKEGSLSSALLERAQSFSSQKISGYTTGKLGDLLGLDQMSIEGNLFRFDRSWGPQLLASKRISRRMTMTYITTVGHFNERSIRLDYELSRHFSLEGETDQRGRSGMSLKYKLRSK